MNALQPITGLNREQVDLLKRTIAKGTSDDEFALFIGQCNRTGLDPFSRQIFPVKRWDNNEHRECMSVQVGIDGFRLIAERTDKCNGQEGPYWCGPDGEWVDAWLDAEPPVAAKVVVRKKGCDFPYTGIARYDSYVQRKRDGTPNVFWTRMPDVMLAKCAEALALRKAFPNDLSGLYLPEEMGTEHHHETPALPPPKSEPPANGKPDPPYIALFKQLGWTPEQGRDFIRQNFPGKDNTKQLTPPELEGLTHLLDCKLHPRITKEEAVDLDQRFAFCGIGVEDAALLLREFGAIDPYDVRKADLAEIIKRVEGTATATV